MSTSAPIASEQYRLFKKDPHTFREPTSEEWMAELHDQNCCEQEGPDPEIARLQRELANARTEQRLHDRDWQIIRRLLREAIHREKAARTEAGFPEDSKEHLASLTTQNSLEITCCRCRDRGKESQ